MSDDNKICGREYKVVAPIQPKYINNHHHHKPYPKIIVKGISHSSGKPIRFRSLLRAKNHIQNMYR